MKNAERIASERRFRVRLEQSAERRAKALAFYEEGGGRTTREVAEEMGYCHEYVSEMIRRGRNERDYQRIHEKA